MLRGGYTLEIGWAVMLLVPILFYIYFHFVYKVNKADKSGPYKDGKLSKKNTAILCLFLGFVALMVILAGILTPV